MRWVGFSIPVVAMLLAGCASQPAATQPTAAGVAPVQQVRVYQPASSTALAFDPPVLAGMPRLDLSREGRGPAAFEGFSEASTQYYSLTTNDWYSDFNRGFGGGSTGPDIYQRQAITQTFGVTTR
jgi:hypothetical protein